MMQRQTTFGCALAISAVVLVGCSEKREDVKPDPSEMVVPPSVPAATPVESPPTDPSASNVQPPSKPSGQVDDPNWMCPPGTSGAKMVLIPVKSGKPYCIDERGATYGEYGKFVEAKGKDFDGQPPECAWNDDYGPVVEWEEPGIADLPPSKCGPSLAEAHPDRVLQCIDFCDAWAFCASSGKRLCGLRGAEPGKVTKVDRDADGPGNDRLATFATSLESEWFNVCSQGGTTKLPYGNTYEPGRCVDETKMAAEGDKALNVADTSNNACHGTMPPYDKVYDMGGSVAQWVNLCSGEICGSLGGHRGPDHRGCADGFGMAYMREFPGGVRCCADAVAKGVEGR